jgi:hypothetical protein
MRHGYSSFVPEHVVNLFHDLLRPLDARFDQLVRPWAALRTAEQVVGGAHVQAGQDCSHDPDDTFASFFHASKVLLRLLFVQSFITTIAENSARKV